MGQICHFVAESGICKPAVLNTAHEAFARRIVSLAGRRLFVLVCDEAHRLNKSNSRIAKAFARLNAVRGLLITGTPVQNNLEEFSAGLCSCWWRFPGCEAERRFQFAQAWRFECTLLATKDGVPCLRRTNPIAT